MELQDKKLQDKLVRIVRVINTLINECVGCDKIRVDGRLQHLQIISKGLERLQMLYPHGYCDERIIDFVVYQIYRYRDYIGTDTRWNISWCFSDMAVAKYRQQFIDENGKSGMNYYIDRWLSEADLSREGLTVMIKDRSEHPMMKMIYIESEDIIKDRFLNTDGGYFICQQSTTGWSPASPVCGQCNNISKCKDVTKKKYPELFRLRAQWKKN